MSVEQVQMIAHALHKWPNSACKRGQSSSFFTKPHYSSRLLNLIVPELEYNNEYVNCIDVFEIYGVRVNGFVFFYNVNRSMQTTFARRLTVD